MSVSDQPHSLAALLQPPIEYETGWAPEPVWIFWRRVQSLPSAMNQTPDHPDGSLVTTSTTLSLLHMLSSHQRLNLPRSLLYKTYMHFCSLSYMSYMFHPLILLCLITLTLSYTG
jgi:hypothetical protein